MVENIPKEIKLECIFCYSTDFELSHKDYAVQDGEAVKCANCGKLNDFSSLKKVAVENVKEKISKELGKQLKSIFKKLK